jgi:hypothetical protein
MDRIGDDQAGFSVGYDPVRGIIEVIAWGFWTADVATAFATKVASACRERPGSTSLVLDMKELKPMREEGQRSFATLVRALPSLGVSRASVVTTSQLTKLQLMRLATENGAGAQIEWVNGTNGLGRNA